MVWRLAFITVVSLLVCPACTHDLEKLLVNETCTENTDCADNICHTGICASPTPSDEGQPCSGSGDCVTYNCVHGFCAPGTRADGEPCLKDAECVSGRCNAARRCGPTALDAGPDAPRPDVALPDLSLPDLVGADVAPPDQAPLDQSQYDANPCGNSKLDPAEPCDGALLGGKTCITQGFTGGTLACTASCKLDESLCYKVLDPKGVKVGGPAGGSIASNPAVATDGAGFMVAWDNPYAPLADRDISAALVDKTGKAGAAFKVTQTSPLQYDPDLAFDGTNYLVVYNDGTFNIYGTRVSAAGNVLDAAGVALRASSNGEDYPAVVFDGTNYLVTWVEYVSAVGSLVGARFSTSLSKLGNVTVASAAADSYQVAFDGTHHLVAWRQGSSMSARVMTAAGVLVGSGALAYGKTGKGRNPAVAVGPAGKGVVVWEDTSAGGTELSGAAVDLKGGKLGATGYVMVSGKPKTTPVIVHDSTNYLVIWEEDNQIRGRRIAPGSLKAVDAKSFVISTDGQGGAKQHPAAVHAGGQTFVVWEDTRAKATRDIYGARITFGGTP